MRERPLPKPRNLNIYISNLSQVIDRWFEDFACYEQRGSAPLDDTNDAFKDELKAIEAWFRVLGDHERTACLASLLKANIYKPILSNS